MADDRRVDQDVERLGRERSERERGEADDLAVVRRAKLDSSSVVAPAVGTQPSGTKAIFIRLPLEKNEPELVVQRMRTLSSPFPEVPFT